jgi:hypothetical protein
VSALPDPTGREKRGYCRRYSLREADYRPSVEVGKSDAAFTCDEVLTAVGLRPRFVTASSHALLRRLLNLYGSLTVESGDIPQPDEQPIKLIGVPLNGSSFIWA